MKAITPMNKTLILFFFLVLTSYLIGVAHAQFDLMEIPTYIDNQLGVGEFIGGLLASMFVLCITLFPIIIMTRGRSTMYGLYVLVGLVVLAPLVGMGWFPIWIYIIIVIALSIGLGRMIADAIGTLRK